MQESHIKAQIELKVEALVNPSEHSEKVIAAITNVIDKCYPELRYGNRVVARSIGTAPLRTIYEQIRSRSAMGVLRRMLIDNRLADTTWFLLNKQAASAGIVVIVEDERESPLGPIRVNIDCEELDTLIGWLVPIKG
jgi:predicted RNA binding protein with dsRBD fold (UPF0201 family)